MKRKYILLLILLIIPKTIFAADFKVSPQNINVYPGDTKTITITSDDSVGRLNISSSNSSIVAPSVSSIFVQTPNSSVTFTISAKSIGSATISVVADNNYASYTTESRLTGLTRTININVINKSSNNSSSKPSSGSNSSPSSNSGSYSPSNASQASSNPNNNANTQNQDNKSKNNNLKNITIDGYEVKKIDDNNYELTVPKNVNIINVKAEAEDSKAIVDGVGEKTLNIGENNIEILITSESGIKNKINLKITRNDSYSLDDLEEALKDNQKVININISSDDVVSSNYLSKIKESKKKVVLEKYNKDKQLLYAWEIDGSKIADYDKFDTNVSYKDTISEEISKLSNYADGLELNLKQKGAYPKGTKVKLSIKGKYKDNDEVNVYYYDKASNKLVLIDKCMVKDGYIEVNPINGGGYFITKSIIADIKDNVTENKNGFRKFIVGLLILIIVVLINGIILIALKRKKKKQEPIN